MRSRSRGKGFYRVNSFDLTHDRKMTFKMGYLTPCLCKEVLPGDTWRLQTDLALRLAPMVAPMMHRVDVFVHYFFVPTRLMWKNWDKFLTGGAQGDENPIYPTKVVAGTSVAAGSLADYLGVPSGNAATVSAFPFRAYAMIYNEWYRDQNVIPPVAFTDADGNDSITNITLLRRAWRKGYFESALPWAQRGEQISVPMGEHAPVKAVSGIIKLPVYANSNTDTPHPYGAAISGGATGTTLSWIRSTSNPQDPTDFDTNMQADLTEASAVTIRDLRLAFQVQRYLEKNARAGVRYIEWLAAHFGVKSSDARLQRPEYLGGGKSPVVVGEVLQTSNTVPASPQGNPAGTGVSAQRTLSFTRSFEEYGWIIGLVSVMPKPAYQQGLDRQLTRFGRYDQVLPILSHIGDQPILTKELYYQAKPLEDDKVFGYAPRYEELRKSYDTVHGQFRTTLDFWHLGRKFNTAPLLNSTFINCEPGKRVFAVTDANQDEIWMHMLHSIKALRPLPKYGDPGMLDHQ